MQRFLTIALFCCLSAPVLADEKEDKAFERWAFRVSDNYMALRASSPRVETSKGFGTAAVVGCDKQFYYLISARHVVEGVKTCSLLFAFPRDREFSAYRNVEISGAEVVALSKDTDLALLRVRTDERLPILRIAASDPPVDYLCLAMGWGKGETQNPRTGKVRKVDNELIYTDPSTEPGYSGGPLYDFLDGRLHGILVGRFKEQPLDIYVSTPRIRAFVKDAGHAWLADK